jgi:murein DD-endopeptidase MepM/ murein hydrolase activator NlpD
LPQETRQAYRQLLEIESDRDRARFPQFPERLSKRIIYTIISLDQAALAKGKIPLRPTMTLDEFAPHVAPPPAHQAKGDDTDSDQRPALVFTEKDIERFKNKRVFLRWPVGGSVSSGFGLRIDPFRRKQSFHQGLDIGARFGAPVHAAANGKVLRHGWLGSCGMGILIEHEGGFRTLYCHLSQILAQLYENVQAGQKIGKIGSTGRSTSPHLHFGLFLNGRAVDPIPYLPSKD